MTLSRAKPSGPCFTRQALFPHACHQTPSAVSQLLCLIALGNAMSTPLAAAKPIRHGFLAVPALAAAAQLFHWEFVLLEA